MLFSFTEEQHELQEMTKDFLESQFPADALRKQWEEGGNASFGIAGPLAELGLLGINIPEEFDGLERDGTDLALVLEEFGYAGVAEPVAFTMGVIAPLVVQYGSDQMKQQWLSRIASGKALFTVHTADQKVVLGASVVDGVLVEQDGELHLVQRDAVTVESVVTMDRSLQAGTCSYVLGEETLLTDSAEAIDQFHALIRAAVASTLIGISQRLLDMTLEYVNVREQFGRKIGSFQAVKHRAADAAVQIEAARSIAWFAHYAIANNDEEYVAASLMAKLAANEAGELANFTALQLHGGVGFTWEYDVHLWLQRGFALEHLFDISEDLGVDLGDYYLERL